MAERVIISTIKKNAALRILEPERICPWSESIRLTFLAATTDSELPPRDHLSCVFVLPFSADGAVELGFHRKRGWDILGGHVEPGETARQAVLRELQEESGRVLREAELKLLGYELLVETGPQTSSQHPYPESCFVYYVASNVETNPNRPRVADDEEMTETRFFTASELSDHKWFSARPNALRAAQLLACSSLAEQ
ncbi:NUDIX hydrolase domain-like protein [Cladochytrium replicatum]|nr:NUDIX hydrolase domain-like protein [Cladochytrium replicatum]